MTEQTELSASLEMYLKTIHSLSSNGTGVHAKEVSETLKVTKPSVTSALRLLASKELINYAPYEAVTLTESGIEIAAALTERFEALKSFFDTALGLPSEQADEVACKMEHDLPKEVRQRLVQFMQYMEICPRGKIIWDEEKAEFYCPQHNCSGK